jgi:hypothetical protein
MRNWMTLVLGLSVAGAGARAGFAQDAKATSKDPPAQAAQEKPADLAKLRAEMHRTMAALIEAQGTEKPDAAKVKELTAKVQELRSKIWGPRPQGPGPGLRGPVGGRGMGMGLGWRGGSGGGQGAGRGPGWGPGPGRGLGAGRGPGWGTGMGRGPGRGFIDQDNDGICDRYEQIWGPGR